MPDKVKRTILIIDDDDTVRNMLKELLEQEGFEIWGATSGAKGMDILETKSPDMIITDLLLPGEHGIELIKKVKHSHNIPVIVISGIYKKRDITEILESQFINAFFAKPLNLDEILDFIRATMNG